jgi:hypothetical protein
MASSLQRKTARSSRRNVLCPPAADPAPGIVAGRVDECRKRSAVRDSGGAAHADPANPWRRQDLAFQQSMMRAVATGQEKPPMIGIFKDARPFDAPRLFEPVPHSSGCTSPARECAELVAVDGLMAGAPAANAPMAGQRFREDSNP